MIKVAQTWGDGPDAILSTDKRILNLQNGYELLKGDFQIELTKNEMQHLVSEMLSALMFIEQCESMCLRE